jgi:hypothetical protein
MNLVLILLAALFGLYPMVDYMKSTNTAWAFYTPPLALVGTGAVIGESCQRTP